MYCPVPPPELAARLSPDGARYLSRIPPEPVWSEDGRRLLGIVEYDDRGRPIGDGAAILAAARPLARAA